jgi:hypothetical protein
MFKFGNIIGGANWSGNERVSWVCLADLTIEEGWKSKLMSGNNGRWKGVSLWFSLAIGESGQ